MRPSFFLTLEGYSGSHILECAKSASRIADILNVTVLFAFNGDQCMARPGDDPESIVERFNEARSKSGPKYVVTESR